MGKRKSIKNTFSLVSLFSNFFGSKLKKKKGMSSSCKGMKKSLAYCVKKTKCFTIDGKTFQECLKEELEFSKHDPDRGECVAEWRGYSLCRVSQVSRSLFSFFNFLKIKPFFCGI